MPEIICKARLCLLVRTSIYSHAIASNHFKILLKCI
uniref:Uncharacterized protein n=1 Tax=Rhizophora mucronata TaxID=61149 RepID=A0A2P2NWS4_RHIMU